MTAGNGKDESGEMTIQQGRDAAQIGTHAQLEDRYSTHQARKQGKLAPFTGW